MYTQQLRDVWMNSNTRNQNPAVTNHGTQVLLLLHNRVRADGGLHHHPALADRAAPPAAVDRHHRRLRALRALARRPRRHQHRALGPRRLRQRQLRQPRLERRAAREQPHHARLAGAAVYM